MLGPEPSGMRLIRREIVKPLSAWRRFAEKAEHLLNSSLPSLPSVQNPAPSIVNL